MKLYCDRHLSTSVMKMTSSRMLQVHKSTFFLVNGIDYNQSDYVLQRECNEELIAFTDQFFLLKWHPTHVTISILAILCVSAVQRSGKLMTTVAFPLQVNWNTVNKVDYCQTCCDMTIQSQSMTFLLRMSFRSRVRVLFTPWKPLLTDVQVAIISQRFQRRTWGSGPQ